ncbi:MAG: cytochrome c maturation protein CcmE [Chloroflexota bacterium]|nr:cytochrome c maturation protein CcmE [Chloroflexota bacterium]
MRKWLLIGIIIICIALGFLIYTSFGNSVTYYVTVGELIQRDSDVYDSTIRVIGKVVDDSIDWNAEELELRFSIEEGNATLPVIYNNTIPNGFGPGADVLVEGKYHTDNVFRASTILMQCPSKYQPED